MEVGKYLGGVNVFLSTMYAIFAVDGRGLVSAQLGGRVCLIGGSWRGFREERREFKGMDTTFLNIHTGS